MAKDRTGVVIAWAMLSPADGGDRIYVTRLDATAHIAGAVHFIPTALAGYAIGPSLAPSPSGYGFILAWMERELNFHVTGAVYCRLDADLKPSAPTILPISPNAVNSPAIVRSGKTTWITAGKSTWQIQSDGSVKDPLPAGVYASDMALPRDFPQLVSGQEAINGYTCRQELGCVVEGGPFRGLCNQICRIPNNVYELWFVSLYTISTLQQLPFESVASPAIGSDGRDLMIAWFNGTQLRGGYVTAVYLPPPARG